MNFLPTILAGSYIIDPTMHQDERGWFGRYFCKEEFQQIGHTKEWLQMNHSNTFRKATLRGMHFQMQPFREIKLVKCVAGAVFDVIIDLRRDSPTFLQWVGEELSAENRRMFYIPEGFAHGFQCLEDNCGLIYHHSEIYQQGAEGGIRHDDPRIGIKWPLPVTLLSPRDAGFPYLDENFQGI